MKTAIVIGAASGIGKGLANAMSDLGIKVIKADTAYPPNKQDSVAWHVDATNHESIRSLANNLQEDGIALDYLLITIGAIDEGQAYDYPEKNLSWMLDVNLLAPYRLIQYFLPFLKNSKSAKILLTGSAAGLGSFEDTYGLMPYIVSKHAVMGYFKALYYELSKDGIEVSLFLPNRIKGRLSENSALMRETFLNENNTSIKGAQQINIELTEPDEIAEEIVEKFLAGKAYISNNPQMMIDKLERELIQMRKDLLDE
ncbi:SDR family oxidoreductase [uncultured Sphingobacterium sp.]|uniref:SDR family NAD(P)-dependent oxidoreductase n=1 Tax=uncultured Sphingobacterium sp. TaxID=182688 RepID=UPI0025CCCB6B|nr:SDR family oxidoreductase [uncultured Sphingobacterium sp.]